MRSEVVEVVESFNEGEKICFKPGTVHLAGNVLDDPPPGEEKNLRRPRNSLDRGMAKEERVVWR